MSAGLYVCLSVLCVLEAREDLDPLDLELQLVVSQHVGAGN